MSISAGFMTWFCHWLPVVSCWRLAGPTQSQKAMSERTTSNVPRLHENFMGVPSNVNFMRILDEISPWGYWDPGLPPLWPSFTCNRLQQRRMPQTMVNLTTSKYCNPSIDPKIQSKEQKTQAYPPNMLVSLHICIQHIHIYSICTLVYLLVCISISILLHTCVAYAI
jgi:hypothetical protein